MSRARLVAVPPYGQSCGHSYQPAAFGSCLFQPSSAQHASQPHFHWPRKEGVHCHCAGTNATATNCGATCLASLTAIPATCRNTFPTEAPAW